MDETQWLPKGIAIITPQRQAKLNIAIEYSHDGSIKYAKSHEPVTILTHLYRTGHLDDLEYSSGRDYQIWREIFRSHCSRQRMAASYGDTPTGSWNSEHSGREQAYSMVIRLLPHTYQKIVDYAVDGLKTENRRYMPEPFQKAFGRLVGAMEHVKKHLDS